MNGSSTGVRLGIAITTVGRWEALEALLDSLDRSSVPATAVAVANQSGAPAPRSLRGRAEVVDSGGGISRGRNDALARLRTEADLVGFPNDNCTYPTGTLAAARSAFAAAGRPAALAGALREPTGIRFALPESGTLLSRWSVWRAIEPALFIATDAFGRSGPFHTALGSGSHGPWQAGEGTEVLLRLLGSGERVIAAPDIVVDGPGERRTLSSAEFRVKQRSYARGVGYVLRLHGSRPWETAAQVLLPWYRFVRPPAAPARRARPGDCLAQSIGRLEGRLGRCVGRTGKLDPLALGK